MPFHVADPEGPLVGWLIEHDRIAYRPEVLRHFATGGDYGLADQRDVLRSFARPVLVLSGALEPSRASSRGRAGFARPVPRLVSQLDITSITVRATDAWPKAECGLPVQPSSMVKCPRPGSVPQSASERTSLKRARRRDLARRMPGELVLQALQTPCRTRRRRRRSRLIGSSHVQRSPSMVLKQPTKREVDHAPWRYVRPTDVDAAPSSRALARFSDTGLGASRNGIAPDLRTKTRSPAAHNTSAPPRVKRLVSLGEACGSCRLAGERAQRRSALQSAQCGWS